MNENNEFFYSDSEDIKQQGKKNKKTFKCPIWVAVVAVFIAAVMSFQATYVVLTDKYNTAINEFESQRSTISSDLGKIYSLIDEISAAFEKNYIYDIDYNDIAERILYDYAIETGDKYAYYYTAEEWAEEVNTSTGNSVGLGVYVTAVAKENSNLLDQGIMVVHVMDDSPAKEAGFEVGDIITHIDGTALSGLNYNDAVAMASGEIGTSAEFDILRGETELKLTLTRRQYAAQTVIYRIIEEDGKKLGYVRITQFLSVTVDQFKNAVKSLLNDGCDGFIFDVRSNPGGYLDAILDILDYILPEGPLAHIVSADGSVETYSSEASCISGKPMVVLANQDTASAAELFTSALMDYDYADMIGTTTYGKGCGQTIMPLSNGGYIKITSFLYNPPYSDNYNGIGIVPDKEVELDENAKKTNLFVLSQDNDSQLLAAIENLLNKLK